MGMTLDQLLDETGVNDLAGNPPRNMAKTAARKPEKTFSKLAERCRAAASTAPSEEAQASTRALVEKTASVAVIQRTLAEITAIAGEEKTASVSAVKSNGARESFIKQALEKGHDPASIAAWLQKNGGLLDRIGRGLNEAKAVHGFESAGKAVARGASKSERSMREWKDIARKAESLGDADKAGLISRMRRKLGDPSAHAVLKDSKAFHGLKEFKDLASAMPQKAVEAAGAAGGGAKKALGVTVGGANIGITGEQAKKLKGPAAMIGAGLLGGRALASRGDGDKKKGVVVVNS